MLSRMLVSLCALVVTVVAGPAKAVFVVGSPGERVELRAQRAFVVMDEPNVTLHLQVAVRGAATSMLWLIPVDGAATTVEPGERVLLDALERVTEPSVTVRMGSIDATGCDDPPNPLTRTARPSTVFPSGEVGQLEGELIFGSSATALAQWIEGEGFTPPLGFADAMATYEDSGMRFVGVRVELDEAPTSTTALRPLTVTLGAPPDRSIRWGTGLAMTTAAASVPTQLYVLANQRFGVRNRASLTLNAVGAELAERLRTGDLFRYAAAYEALGGSESAALVESAGPLVGDLAADELRAWNSATVFYLTSIRTQVLRDGASDLIISFDSEGPEVSRSLTVDTEGMPVTAFVLVALFVVRRRRVELGTVEAAEHSTQEG